MLTGMDAAYNPNEHAGRSAPPDLPAAEWEAFIEVDRLVAQQLRLERAMQAGALELGRLRRDGADEETISRVRRSLGHIMLRYGGTRQALKQRSRQLDSDFSLS